MCSPYEVIRMYQIFFLVFLINWIEKFGNLFSRCHLQVLPSFRCKCESFPYWEVESFLLHSLESWPICDCFSQLDIDKYWLLSLSHKKTLDFHLFLFHRTFALGKGSHWVKHSTQRFPGWEETQTIHVGREAIPQHCRPTLPRHQTCESKNLQVTSSPGALWVQTVWQIPKWQPSSWACLYPEL